MAQCQCAPQKGSELRASHARQQGRLTYGRFDNAFLDTEAFRKQMWETALRMKTEGFTYYTRTRMWQYAAEYSHVHDLDDLTPEEYVDCLAKVDTYFLRALARVSN